MRGTDVLVDGQIVDALGENIGRLRRLDHEFEALNAWRMRWKSEHGGAAFPGVAAFWFDRDLEMAELKSVFYTAAYAGYPNAMFVVRTESGQVARVNVDARVPGPSSRRQSPANSSSGEPVLHVEMASDAGVQLVWKQGTSVWVGSKVSGPLAEAVAAEWNARGVHRAAADVQVDRVVLHAPNSLRYAQVAAVLDAINAPARDYVSRGGASRVQVFSITLAVN